MQSLELKNARGNIVGKGNHDSPKRVTEVSSAAMWRGRTQLIFHTMQYFVFQREMWRPDDNWRMVKRVQVRSSSRRHLRSWLTFALHRNLTLWTLLPV